MLVFDAAKTGLVLLFFTYASWSDYKSREVSDRVWIVLGPLSLILTLSELFLYEPSQFTAYGICFGLTSVFAIVLFYTGAFGGADAKALMCLALALPFYPELLPSSIGGVISPISETFFPITVFSNSVLFAAFMAVALLFYNLFWRASTDETFFEGDLRNESWGKKITVMITGYKTPIGKLKEKWHVYPMEDIEQDPQKGFKRKLVIIPKDEGRNNIVERLETAKNAGNISDKVWATPGLPMLIFVTAGLVVALLLGDVIWICVRLVLR